MTEIETPRAAAPGRSARAAVVRTILVAYAVGLALVGFWPTHVDQGIGPFLRLVTRIFPLLTYARIEFSANIALFVPLGVLLMLILRRRYLIVPIALVVTVTIESGQSLMGGARTSSLRDVVANLTGACVGMLIVALVEWLAARGVGGVDVAGVAVGAGGAGAGGAGAGGAGAGAGVADAGVRAGGTGGGAEAGSRTSRE